MSQVQAPREFKFVGAFSRKRRRRDGVLHSAGSRSRAHTPSTTPRRELAAALATHTSSFKITNEKEASKEKNTDGESSPVAQMPEMQLPLEAAPLICQENANPFDEGMMLRPSDECMSHGNDADWMCSGFMNPFLDPGASYVAPFDQLARHEHLPIYFGPDISNPLEQIEDSPSTDNSTQDDLFEPNLSNENEEGVAVEASAIEEVALSSLSSQEATCNIGMTITQLLTRCK